MLTALSDDGDSTLQAKTKAVVFTHINLKPEDVKEKGSQACIEEYVILFERYLGCRNAGLVYLYLSLGAEELTRAIVEGKPLLVSPDIIEAENSCIDILRSAEVKARETYPGKPRKFIYVTTTQLISLYTNLHQIDPSLFDLLTRSGYDSPKFVEAVIRIARGQDPRSAYYPVVRFDEDVQICEKSLDKLLTAYEDLLVSNKNLYFFFSGCYGDPDDPDKTDPINDRAVRAHWLVDEQFRRDDEMARAHWFDKDQNEPLKSVADRIKLFWRDLGEVGATQLSVESDPSIHGQSLIAERGFTANRRVPQVISGTGLIMSLRAIQDLPPFMNMNRLIVWVDDHLKRQLYEAIDDISKHDLESVVEARFKQDRHPTGITKGDVAWATANYFERILAGCMMDALISQPVVKKNRLTRVPTEYAQAIKSIIGNSTVETDHESLKVKLSGYAGQRYDRVLMLWQTPEFSGTDLYQWAKTRDAEHKENIVKDIVANACAYLELVKHWRTSFAAAIGRLRPIGNLWLFESVR